MYIIIRIHMNCIIYYQLYMLVKNLNKSLLFFYDGKSFQTDKQLLLNNTYFVKAVHLAWQSDLV